MSSAPHGQSLSEEHSRPLLIAEAPVERNVPLKEHFSPLPGASLAQYLAQLGEQPHLAELLEAVVSPAQAGLS